jgi:phosphoribosyl-ATP pyrophosphohydrolase
MTKDTGDGDNGGDVLDRLFAVIEERRGGDSAESYTARLLAEGADRIAQKLGEEAIETVIAAAKQDRAALIGESADLLYHLLVLWAASDIGPGEVWAELGRREGRSGLEEKRSRSG